MDYGPIQATPTHGVRTGFSTGQDMMETYLQKLTDPACVQQC